MFDPSVQGKEVSTKDTNPKDAIGSSKLPLHLWPTTATAMGSIGLLEGMLKYGRMNWRNAGVRASIYVDACKRHLDAWFEGEDVAPDSGVPHLANALACLAIIVDAQAAGKLNDDRAYSGTGYRELVESLTPHVNRLKALHADKEPKHWTAADRPSEKRRCYVAGPMTGKKDLNFPAFNAEAARLRQEGWEVLNPAEINPDHSKSWEACMRSDLAALVTCDAISLLPGWENSKGATLEHHVAQRLGLEVFLAPALEAEAA